MSEEHARPINIAVIPGDGIGPELVRSALEVLWAVAELDSFALATTEEPGGAGHYRETGQALDPDGLERLRTADAVLKGPVGLPEVRKTDGTEAGLLGGILRIGLDTFANVRPITLFPGVAAATRHRPDQVDYAIVRENTEGLYRSRGSGVATPHAACDQLLVTRHGATRVIRFAFDLARSRGDRGPKAPHVTCVDKSNVLRSYALFREVFGEVAREYPDVTVDYLYADTAGHELVANPDRFDVLVMENFLGDILSDVGAATVGGLGMCGSGNIGVGTAYFEPIHGSAPTIAGQDRANPVSQILSAAMLLDHVGRPRSGNRIRDAVTMAFEQCAVVLNENGSPVDGTASVTRAVIERI